MEVTEFAGNVYAYEIEIPELIFENPLMFIDISHEGLQLQCC